MMLAVLILIPLAAAVMVAVAPASRARLIAMVGMLAAAAMTGFLLFSFDWEHTAVQQFLLDEESSRLIAPLGVSLSMSVDSISMMLVTLIFSLRPATPGFRQQTPRRLSSILTPALDAS